MPIVLAVSDTHGNSDALRRVLELHPEATHLFHMGDGAADLEELMPCRPLTFRVAGNCDRGSSPAEEAEAVIDGVRFFAVHGHTYGVKYNLSRLWYAARQRDCRVVLFGHTHCPLSAEEDGILLVNPGSLGLDRRYALLYLQDGRVTVEEHRLP